MQALPRQKIVVGTRGSDLAQRQTQSAVEVLRKQRPNVAIEVKIIRTMGDTIGSKTFDRRAGRKGLFTAELERALLAKDIDVAVHSAKDLPSQLTPGTELGAVLRRGAVDDALLAGMPCDLKTLPANAIVATGSTRRQHQLRWKRPDLEIVELKGNVPTRLRKLGNSEWHAIVLARAGLERLGLISEEHWVVFEGRDFSIDSLPTDTFVPAGGQGTIAIQVRSEDEPINSIVSPLNHFDTGLCLRAEREFLRLLQADCDQPVGVLATVDGTSMKMRAQIFDLHATTPREGSIDGRSAEADRLAAALLEQINTAK